MSGRALLIVNTKSRSGAAQCDIAIDRLRDHDIEPVHLECGRREELSPLIVEHAKDVDCAIVGGGDGTINAAAFGVNEAGLPLGILPMGTANDLARTLGIPFDLDGAVRHPLPCRNGGVDASGRGADGIGGGRGGQAPLQAR